MPAHHPTIYSRAYGLWGFAPLMHQGLRAGRTGQTTLASGPGLAHGHLLKGLATLTSQPGWARNRRLRREGAPRAVVPGRGFGPGGCSQPRPGKEG